MIRNNDIADQEELFYNPQYQKLKDVQKFSEVEEANQYPIKKRDLKSLHRSKQDSEMRGLNLYNNSFPDSKGKEYEYDNSSQLNNKIQVE